MGREGLGYVIGTSRKGGGRCVGGAGGCGMMMMMMMIGVLGIWAAVTRCLS